MVSSLEAPVRAQSASLSLPATGGESRVTQVAFPLVYSGPFPSKVLAFAAASSGEAVQLELVGPETADGGDGAAWKGVVRLRGAKLLLPKSEEEKPRVHLAVVLAREEVAEVRALLDFLLDASEGEALELELKAEVVQPPLPFAPPEEEAPAPEPAPRGRRKKG